MPRNPVRASATAFAALLLAGPAAAQPMDWLSVCSKCMSPKIFRTSGLGTANAVAEARYTRASAAEWCDSWQPGDPGCVAAQLAAEDTAKIHRASADCTRGRITPIDGQTYTHAGLWGPQSFGAGRSRWRDARGAIVGDDNASGGLGISQQWEVLCPKGLVAASATAPAASGPMAGADYRVGQSVEARYFSDWVPARITRVRPLAGGGFEYDVQLANGKAGIVPPRMLRPAGAR